MLMIMLMLLVMVKKFERVDVMEVHCSSIQGRVDDENWVNLNFQPC